MRGRRKVKGLEIEIIQGKRKGGSPEKRKPPDSLFAKVQLRTVVCGLLLEAHQRLT
jgi:hypothetical protein